MRATLSIAVVTCLFGCDQRPDAPASPSTPTSRAVTPSTSTKPSVAPLSPRTEHPEPHRLVAIGDLHGDLDAARKALRLAGAIDDKDAWSGKDLVVVQTGDEIDRGDGDRAILDLIERLKGEAARAGGALLAMAGNHEVMNTQLDFRYVTKGAFATFADLATDPRAARFSALDPTERGRAVAFFPGGPYATMLADRPIVLKVGATLFAHGGVLPKHVAYGLDRINDEMRAYMRGERPEPPAIVVAEDGPIWTRAYSDAPTSADCHNAESVLAAVGAKRMVVGHTVQKSGVTSACDGKVWRIDVGMSHFFGGPVEDLEVSGDKVQVDR